MFKPFANLEITKDVNILASNPPNNCFLQILKIRRVHLHSIAKDCLLFNKCFDAFHFQEKNRFQGMCFNVHVHDTFTMTVLHCHKS